MSASLLRANVCVSCGLAFFALAATRVGAPVYTAHDLNGPGPVESLAADVSKGKQVGYANTPRRHAMLWSGPAGGAVDLHPAGFQFSQATAVHEGRQGGFAETTDVHQGLGFSTTHAVVWSGTAASAVDLHPASGYSASRVSAVYGGRQFGSAAAGYFNDARDHAAMWEGSSGSFADIHPAGFAVSRVAAASADQLVGSAVSVSADPDHSGVHAILRRGARACLLTPGSTFGRRSTSWSGK